MTEERKEQRDIDAGFKNTFFNALKNAGKDVSIDEDGYIVLNRRLIEQTNRHDYNKEKSKRVFVLNEKGVLLNENGKKKVFNIIHDVYNDDTDDKDLFFMGGWGFNDPKSMIGMLKRYSDGYVVISDTENHYVLGGENIEILMGNLQEAINDPDDNRTAVQIALDGVPHKQ